MNNNAMLHKGPGGNVLVGAHKGQPLGLLPFGHHTLGIECKGVLPTGVDRMLAGNRVGVGLTRSPISSFAPISIFQKPVLMVVSTPWRGCSSWAVSRMADPSGMKIT